jgi:hypothetical protein
MSDRPTKTARSPAERSIAETNGNMKDIERQDTGCPWAFAKAARPKSIGTGTVRGDAPARILWSRITIRGEEKGAWQKEI